MSGRHPGSEGAAGAPARVRFAPSPTGALHLGNARTALFNWLVARQSSGTMLLRIEDTDVERQQPQAEQGILADLRWLGLDWDEGPDVGGPHGPYRQSERADRYLEAARRLLASGRTYRCFCPEARLEVERRDALAAGRPPHYSGRCRSLAPAEAERRAGDGEPFVLRLDVGFGLPRTGTAIRFRDRLRGFLEVDSREVGDPVLLRRDGSPTYNFAVVVDDAAMDVNLVLRGDDHLSNTPRQVLLFEALGHPVPEFAHLPTVRGEDGSKLSKRHGAVSLAEYRARGYPAEAVFNALALLGWAPDGDRQVLGREEILAEFDLERISRAAARFDPARLDWLSGQHLQRKDPGELAPGLGARLVAAGLLAEDDLEVLRGWLLEVADLVRHAVTNMDQAVERCGALFASGGEPANEGGRAALRAPGAAAVLDALQRAYRERPPTDPAIWAELKQRIASESGVKGRKLFHPIRVALTGEDSGPELDRLIPLIVTGSRLRPDRIPTLDSRLERTRAWAR